MAFPARYNYLYRIGALWLTLINALLRFVAGLSFTRDTLSGRNT
jgi:hypothetical protein